LFIESNLCDCIDSYIKLGKRIETEHIINEKNNQTTYYIAIWIFSRAKSISV
jgi:hypothetical protein